MVKQHSTADIFTEEDVELLSEAFKASDKRIVNELIHDLGHDIIPLDYPSCNPLTWPFRDYNTRRCWVTKVITKKDYHALVNHEFVDDDSKISAHEAETFLKHYTDRFGVGWTLLRGWTKFWFTPSGETGYRLAKKVGNPISNVRHLAKILTPDSH